MNLEELRTLGRLPIAGDRPTGADVRYEPDYERLDAEMAKLESLDGQPVDWSVVLDTATAILREQSKDLLVAARLARGLFERHGYEGLVTGLIIIQEMIKHYWDDLYPAARRARARAGALSWLADTLAAVCARREPGAGDEKPLLESLATLGELENDLEQRMGEQAPSLFELRRLFKSFKEQFEREAAAPAPIPAAPAASPAQGAPAPPPAAPSVAVAASSIDNDTEANKAVRQCQDLMRKLSAYQRRRKLSDPVPYQALRVASWMGISQLPPATDGVTALREVPVDKVRAYAGLLEAGRFEPLINEVENSFSRAPFWLDAHRLVAGALEGLGAEYADARAAVVAQVAAFVRRFPQVVELKFSGGTPFADELTRLWINKECLAAPAPPPVSDECDGPGSSPPPEEDQYPWLAAAAEARHLAARGKLEQGLVLFENGRRTAHAARERFYWDLALAKCCLECGQVALAAALLDDLDQQAERYDLEEWEPALSLEVARLLLLCNDKSNTQEGAKRLDAPKRRWLARLCRLDIGAALKAKL